MKRLAKRSALSLTALTLTAVAVYYVLNIFEYSLLATVRDDGTVQIQTLSLGEYYTPVTSFEIYEFNTGNKVVTLVAKSENSRMHTVTLRTGVTHFNDVYLDDYVVNYVDGNHYSFIAGVSYTAKVRWGLFTKEVSFALPNRT